MKVFEILDDHELQLMMDKLLKKAGFEPHFAMFRNHTALSCPVKGGKNARLYLKGDTWKVDIIGGQGHKVASAELNSEDVIGWLLRWQAGPHILTP